MKYFYICSTQGYSGICKYAADFYELVLKRRGYILIDSNNDLSDIFTTISSIDHVHIEIGIFQKREIEILFLMLKAHYKNIAITMHDPPLLKYPFRKSNNALLNKMYKFYDRFLSRFDNSLPYITKIKTIYVLSLKGASIAKSIYKTDNIFYLPHVVNTTYANTAAPINKNFIYFGFIGKNKDIEYALQLHQKILITEPDVQFYIIGNSIGNEARYHAYLKKTYQRNVHFLGYVEEKDLSEIYNNASFALSLFKDYKYFYPISGSVLHNLKMFKIVLTTEVNSIPEIIKDKENGFYLNYDLQRDSKLVLDLYENHVLLRSVLKKQWEYLVINHSPETVQKYLRDQLSESIPGLISFYP